MEILIAQAPLPELAPLGKTYVVPFSAFFFKNLCPLWSLFTYNKGYISGLYWESRLYKSYVQIFASSPSRLVALNRKKLTPYE